ncbi:MAG: hypothetical protein LUD15_07005 [Bacteroides sp.]|nr:hypothetical protein [Bacteroides sp.]
MENSIPVGLTEEGLTKYDTVWVYPNHFLDQFDLGNEDANYEFVLLEDENYRTLTKKYHKYMLYPTEQQTDSIITNELIRNLVFFPGSSTVVSGIEVDFSNSELANQYTASNGTVKTMRGVDIRIKDNKIKEIYIEGEDLVSSLNPEHVFIRSYLS